MSVSKKYEDNWPELMSDLKKEMDKQFLDDLVKKVIGVEPLEATEFMKKSLKDRYGSK